MAVIISVIRQFLILNLDCFVKIVIIIRGGIYIVKRKKRYPSGMKKGKRAIYANLLRRFGVFICWDYVVCGWYDGCYSIRGLV